ncbi:hypothetical protein SPRG_14867 [Saprolegnia parasitica CBS 223.65]|uniref:RING-type domain-containing protein n=1 Tax=Saprolegnia parasitica (strain CBS 223.65) TaxID=695850 RepID=A0A067BXQ2_SAPPC|nr:hypothetical protein SPRG_14867 [Saprolegnia parasitica CBS 223.65]KDO19347.1 hypothetical protein SPRG_14867 [Saprolegnia parasitica CBS 223.65]|eukprot:XP_012209935.1 hypothetical protein SPRG_14867 [Saprolegnia parasitica CBS 223.65]
MTDGLPSTLEAIDVRANVAAKAGNVYAQYTVVITCPFTQARWSCRKRYSAFWQLRETFRVIHAHAPASPLAPLLHALLATPFPSKHLTPTRARVMGERAMLFQNFLLQLLHLRNACWVNLAASPSLALPAARYVALIADFLGIYDVPMLEIRPTTRAILDEACAICLDYMHATDLVDGRHVVQLPCRHVYHQRCVGQWLRTKRTCPLCRDPTTQITGLLLA